MRNMASLSLESDMFTLLFPLILRNADVAKIRNQIQQGKLLQPLGFIPEEFRYIQHKI